MIWFCIIQFYLNPRPSYGRDSAVIDKIWPIYRGEWTRKVIELIVKNAYFNMFFNMSIMLIAITMLLMFAMEYCIVNSCVPEYKGTYDETQDELLAVDWEVDDG
jgi:hypothetical protein